MPKRTLADYFGNPKNSNGPQSPKKARTANSTTAPPAPVLQEVSGNAGRAPEKASAAVLVDELADFVGGDPGISEESRRALLSYTGRLGALLSPPPPAPPAPPSALAVPKKFYRYATAGPVSTLGALARALEPPPPPPLERMRALKSSVSGRDRATQELAFILPEVARETIFVALDGRPSFRSNAAIPAANTNQIGCWIPNTGLAGGGYTEAWISIERDGPKKAAKGESTKALAPKRQYRHRLAVVGWHDYKDVEMMVLGRDPSGNKVDVSHLCDERKCCNPLHIIVEWHAMNERRKHCNGGLVCVCAPACLRMS